MPVLNHTFCVAPMMDWTDRHDRYFLRLISRHAVLYTEMVTTGALLHGDTARLLRFDTAERPVALQVGGSDPVEMARAARLGADAGYDEININVGCPSERVQRGAFGACLMAEPALVGDCVAAMRAAVDIPVTVKTRIGIDERDSYEELAHFVATMASAGCETLIIHARKAWLKGLSPKENRDVPPLDYERVYRIKQDFPDLEIIVNGGVKTLEECEAHLERLDGVMMGREAYHNPYLLAQVDARLYGDLHPVPSRHEILERLYPYLEAELASGVYLGHMTRHILGLFQGMPGARKWRRYLSEHAHRPGAGLECVREAAALVHGSA